MDSHVTASQCLVYSRARRVDGGEWRGLTEELDSVVRTWKQICELLCSRWVSVPWASLDNRTKRTVDRAMDLEYWTYKCRVISCERSVSITDYCNCMDCSVNEPCCLLNQQAYQLQYFLRLQRCLSSCLLNNHTMKMYEVMELLVSALLTFTVDRCESWVSSTGSFIFYETTTSGCQNPFLITRLLIFEHDIPAK
jgi:hypothetical protein